MGKINKIRNLYRSMHSKRDPNFFVFGSWWGNKFADNPKYLFLYMLSQGKTVMWVTKSETVLQDMKCQGYPVCMADSEEGIRACSTAKYIIYCTGTADVNENYIGGAVLINLWHGIPLKKIMYDDKINNSHRSLKSRGWDVVSYLPFKNRYIATTSDRVTEIYKHAFRMDRSHLLQWGQPRNDCFFDGSLNRREYSDIAYDKLIVYMPTHRNEGKTPIEIDKIFDLKKLNALCAKHNALFLIKKHYYHSSERADFTAFPYIIDCTSEQLDTQELLFNADCLITDYSSCYIDYLLLKRPILFYAYDYKDYLLNDREMYFNFEDVTPGPKSYEFAQFEIELEKTLSGQDEWGKRRTEITDLFYDRANQGRVSPSIVEKMRKL